MSEEAFIDYINFSGSTVSEFEGTRQYLSTGALKGNYIDYNELEEVTFQSRPSRANINVDVGDILFAKMQNTIKVLKISDETKDLIVSTGFFVVRPKEEVDSEFIFQYLNSSIFNTQKDRYCSGATQKAINNSGLKNIIVPSFEIETQRRIGYALKLITQARAIRQQQIEVINKTEQDLFLSMFGEPIENRMDWPISPLSEISTLERGRFSPRPRNDPKYYNGDYPFVQTGDINGCDHRLLAYTQTLNELGIQVSKEFPIGTILIALVGATVGATAILLRNVYAPDSVIGITVDTDKCTNVFLEMQLRFWRQWLLDYAPDAARANINLEILSPLKVIVPPLPLQLEFENKMNLLEEQKARLRSSLTELETTYKSTLQKAFNGELFQ